MFPIPFYQPKIPRLCINAFQFLKSWWYTDFTNKIMTLLETAGLCALMFACFLYRIEKQVFEKVNLYGIVYDAGSSICSLVGSMIPPANDGPRFRPRPSPLRRPRRMYSNPFPWSQRPKDKRRNKSVIANQRGKIDTFEIEMAPEQSESEHA